MTQPYNDPRRDDHDDLARVTQEIGGRLRARGVAVNDDDSPESLVRLLDAVEAFERAVSVRGGDLMMDEPPLDEIAEPDDPAFLLPARAADESITGYIQRLWAATTAARARGPLP